MRTLLVLLVLLLLTPVLGLLVVLAALIGVPDRDGAIYDWAPRAWSRALLRAAGVRVVVHHPERMQGGAPRIFASNHVSWFDVFTLASLLPRYKFVGKAELFRIPIFGQAALAAGMIPIERENRKAAFQSYDRAVASIRAGASVVVYPEGTRGADYALRSFKKGPFVLAAAAQVPIVPTVLHGTLRVQPRARWRIRSGTVHVHFLEPIETRGMTYDDRDRLSAVCWERMATALRSEYHVESRPWRVPGVEQEPVNAS
ncbi:MAG TPA: lysophospholipid acyltransferase family protein [Gemmatimonadaceae bacterium]|nr:lysophospholipid acyltransferase family protein [Gemmatimonadaceae bacterium]